MPHVTFKKMHERFCLLLVVIGLPAYTLSTQDYKLLKSTFLKDKSQEHLTWLENFIAEDSACAYERITKYLDDNMNYLNRNNLLEILVDITDFQSQKGFIRELEFYAIMEVAKIWKLESTLIQSLKKNKLKSS